MWVVLVAGLTLACARDRPAPPPAETTSSSRSAQPDAPAAAGPVALDLRAPCPATGRWSECGVVTRLDRAGLAPRIDSTRASEPPLAPRGLLLHLGPAEIEIYIYPDAESRTRDEAKLDRSQYLNSAAPQSMRPLPTLIHSVNLIAILHSRSDHLRERVSDAITAGPPQPVAP